MQGEEEELSVSIAHIVQKLKGTTLHCQLEKEARGSLFSPDIKLETLKEDIKVFLKASGWEKKLQNAVYRELSVLPAPCHPAAPAEHIKEPLAYMRRAQASWEKRVLKSLNSMCTELNIPLARKRPIDEQKELLNKWNEMGTDEPDLSLFRPVYAPKDFLEVLINLRNPNYDIGEQPSYTNHLGLIQVPLKIKDIPELREFFKELSLNTGQLGVDDSTPVPPELFENEHFQLGKKVLAEHDSAAAQQYVRQGCPTALRADLWALILNISDQPEVVSQIPVILSAPEFAPELKKKPDRIRITQNEIKTLQSGHGFWEKGRVPYILSKIISSFQSTNRNNGRHRDTRTSAVPTMCSLTKDCEEVGGIYLCSFLPIKNTWAEWVEWSAGHGKRKRDYKMYYTKRNTAAHPPFTF